MATKINKADLFDDGADSNSRGYKKNLNTNGEPDQELMENWNESIAWKTEDGDRARQSTGGEPVEDLKGLVQVATDAEAKANTSGLEADTTKVVHASQLPTVDATESQTVGALNDVLLEVADDGTTTRNNFLVKLSEVFRGWLDTLRGDVDTNTTNISTNATNISNNATNISNNASDITNIEGDITSLQAGNLTVRDEVLGTSITANTLKMSTDFDVVDEGSGVARVEFVKDTSPTFTWSTKNNSEVPGYLAANYSSGEATGTYIVTSNGSSYTRYVSMGENVLLYAFQLDINIVSSLPTVGLGTTIVDLTLDLGHTGKTLATSITPSVAYVSAVGGHAVAPDPTLLVQPVSGNNELRMKLMMSRTSSGTYNADFRVLGQIHLYAN